MKKSGPRIISTEALRVLQHAVVTYGRLGEWHISIAPTGQLPRPIYKEVNDVLTSLDAKWNRGTQSHIVGLDPRPALEMIATSGVWSDTKRDYDQFHTPRPLALDLCHRAGMRDGMREGHTVLEPSAGHGAIADAARNLGAAVTTCEVEPKSAAILRSLKHIVWEQDFLLRTPPGPGKLAHAFDRVVMNPPFSRQQDIDHVLHAWKFLAPDGVLVSVMGMGVAFRDNAKTERFRQFLRALPHGIEELPEGSFAASGTNVRAVVLRIGEP